MIVNPENLGSSPVMRVKELLLAMDVVTRNLTSAQTLALKLFSDPSSSVN